MIVFALDTTTAYTCVALLDGERVLGERREPSRSHSKSLLPSMVALLADCGVSIGDVDLIGVGIGPGSFTGVRIGLTMAKTLAFVRKLPLVGVSSLLALAHNVQQHDPGATICPAQDALKNEVYCAAYCWDEKGLTQLQQPCAKDPDQWSMELFHLYDKVYILGSALEKYAGIFQDNLGDKLVLPRVHEQNFIQAGFIGKVATEKFIQTGGDDPEIIEPMYCRLSEAELGRKKKN